MSAIVKIIVGVLFGGLCGLALSPAFAAMHDETSSMALVVFWIAMLAVVILSFFAPSIRRALGRGFLMLGACLWFLPISAMMLSGKVSHEMVSTSTGADQAAAAIGSGIAAVAVTGAATFLGIILGTICLIIGLVLALGGRREVIIVTR